MRILCVSCHPDDCEFMMAGTLFLLKQAGCEIHYINIANGSCGSDNLPAEEIISIRRTEGMNAADYLGATFHESLVNDIEVFYSDQLIRRITALVREVKPDIMLVPSLEDYMEDHMNTARLAVTAAFCRGMRNYISIPPMPPTFQDVEVYHALPYTLTDGMNTVISPEICVDISAVINEKEKMLACHKSQKSWLDVTQGFDSYLTNMRCISGKIGKMSGKYKFAEGWRKHLHVGLSKVNSYKLLEIPGIKSHFM